MKDHNHVKSVARYLELLDQRGDTSVLSPGEASIESTELLSIRQQLGAMPRLEVPAQSRALGKQALLTALLQHSQREETSLRKSVISAMTTKVGAVAAGLLLASTAVGASAAFGGPNLPGQVLSSIGVTGGSSQPDQSTKGINNAPDAAQTGKDHANDDHAFDGANNATPGGPASLPTAATQGINNAPDAAQTGKDHANDHAFNGAGNAQNGGPASLPTAATQGINNAPAAAQTGKEHANDHASNGAGNATGANSNAGTSNTSSTGANSTSGTATLPAQANAQSGIGNAPAAAQTAISHAAPQSGAGSGNAPVTAPPTGAGQSSQATTHGGGH